jgi:hypothetical protein
VSTPKTPSSDARGVCLWGSRTNARGRFFSGPFGSHVVRKHSPCEPRGKGASGALLASPAPRPSPRAHRVGAVMALREPREADRCAGPLGVFAGTLASLTARKIVHGRSLLCRRVTALPSTGLTYSIAPALILLAPGILRACLD